MLGLYHVIDISWQGSIGEIPVTNHISDWSVSIVIWDCLASLKCHLRLPKTYSSWMFGNLINRITKKSNINSNNMTWFGHYTYWQTSGSCKSLPGLFEDLAFGSVFKQTCQAFTGALGLPISVMPSSCHIIVILIVSEVISYVNPL